MTQEDFSQIESSQKNNDNPIWFEILSDERRGCVSDDTVVLGFFETTFNRERLEGKDDAYYPDATITIAEDKEMAYWFVDELCVQTPCIPEYADLAQHLLKDIGRMEKNEFKSLESIIDFLSKQYHFGMPKFIAKKNDTNC